GLGYDSQMNESEVVHSMFNNRESDVDDSQVNYRFKIGEGFHAVLPPYTGNYMPSRPDLSFAGPNAHIIKEWDTDSNNDSVFRPKSDQTKPKFTKINFVKSVVATKSGQVPVNDAKQSSSRAATSISTARMRMEQYLTFTDHALWEVIVNGDSVSPVASASAGSEDLVPPKTAE
ncbi:hypothetical protein Tco_1036788, partial [Tanacetum coccineum]